MSAEKQVPVGSPSVEVPNPLQTRTTPTHAGIPRDPHHFTGSFTPREQSGENTPHGRSRTGTVMGLGISDRGTLIRMSSIRPRAETVAMKEASMAIKAAEEEATRTPAITGARIADLTGIQNTVSGNLLGNTSLLANVATRVDDEMTGFPAIRSQPAEIALAEAAAARLRAQTALGGEYASVITSGATSAHAVSLSRTRAPSFLNSTSLGVGSLHRHPTLESGKGEKPENVVSTTASTLSPSAVIGRETSIPAPTTLSPSAAQLGRERAGTAHTVVRIPSSRVALTRMPSKPPVDEEMEPLQAEPPTPSQNELLQLAAEQLELHEYVAGRSGRRQREEDAWPWWYRCYRRGLTRFVLTLRMLFTLIIVGLGVLFQFAFPTLAFGENPVYKWMYLFGGTFAVLYVLEAAVWAAFALANAMMRCCKSGWLEEALSFANAVRNHIAHLGAVVFTLLLKTTIFNLSFSSDGEFFFVATCASLIFLKAAMMIRNIALQIVLRALYRKRQSKPVADALFYAEAVWRLTDPNSTSESPAELTSTVPTILLENDSFWTQAEHIKSSYINAFDENGRLLPIKTVEQMHNVSKHAFDRLYEHAVVYRRYHIKQAIVDYLHDDFKAIEDARKARDAVMQQRASMKIQRKSTTDLVGKVFFNKHGHSSHKLKPIKSPVPESPIDAITEQSSGKLRRTYSAGNLVVTPPPDGSPPAQPSPSSKTVGRQSSKPKSSTESKQIPASLLSPVVDTSKTTAKEQYYFYPVTIDDIPDVPDVSRWMTLGRHLLALKAKYGFHPDVYSTNPDDMPHEHEPAASGFPATAHILEQVVAWEQELVDLATTSKATLRLQDIQACFGTDRDAAAAFRLLDLDGNGSVSRDEFIGSTTIMFNAWINAQSASQSYGGISGAIQILVNVAYWITLILVIMAIFKVNLNQVLVPLTTTMIAFGFAIGPTVQRLIDSLLFVLVISPYDVGDKVSISTISGGATITVSKVYLLYSEFVDGTNKRVISRNADLISQNIFNFRRSGDLTMSSKYWVEMSISSAVLANLKAAVEAFVVERAVSWKPNVSASVVPGENNRLELAVTVTHRCTWQDPGKSGTDHTELILHVCSLLTSWNIKYSLPNQHVFIDSLSMDTAGALTKVENSTAVHKSSDATLDKIVSFATMKDVKV